MAELSTTADKSYIAKIDWPSLDSATRGQILQYLNYQVQTANRAGLFSAANLVDDTPLWKEYQAGKDWTWLHDRAAYEAGRYAGYGGFSDVFMGTLSQALGSVPYGGNALQAVLAGEPILKVLAGETAKAYVLQTVGEGAIAKLEAAAAPAAAVPVLSTTGAPPMDTIPSTASVPTFYDELSGIFTGGVKQAAKNTVTRLLEPAQRAPQYGEPGYTGFVSGANALNIPVWGWALAGVIVAGLFFVALKK